MRVPRDSFGTVSLQRDRPTLIDSSGPPAAPLRFSLMPFESQLARFLCCESRDLATVVSAHQAQRMCVCDLNSDSIASSYRVARVFTDLGHRRTRIGELGCVTLESFGRLFAELFGPECSINTVGHRRVGSTDGWRSECGSLSASRSARAISMFAYSAYCFKPVFLQSVSTLNWPVSYVYKRYACSFGVSFVLSALHLAGRRIPCNGIRGRASDQIRLDCVDKIWKSRRMTGHFVQSIQDRSCTTR